MYKQATRLDIALRLGHHRGRGGRGCGARSALGPLDVGAHVDASEQHVVALAAVRPVARDGIQHDVLVRWAQCAVLEGAVAEDVPEALFDPPAAAAAHSGNVGRAGVVVGGSAARYAYEQRAQRRQAARNDADRALDQAPGGQPHQ